MSDCLWYAITACDGECCRCEHYLSMNSDDGRLLAREYERRVEAVLKPLAVEFAQSKGFNALECCGSKEDR